MGGAQSTRLACISHSLLHPPLSPLPTYHLFIPFNCLLISHFLLHPPSPSSSPISPSSPSPLPSPSQLPPPPSSLLLPSLSPSPSPTSSYLSPPTSLLLLLPPSPNSSPPSLTSSPGAPGSHTKALLFPPHPTLPVQLCWHQGQTSHHLSIHDRTLCHHGNNEISGWRV